jgi:hypothetical protein
MTQQNPGFLRDKVAQPTLIPHQVSLLFVRSLGSRTLHEGDRAYPRLFRLRVKVELCILKPCVTDNRDDEARPWMGCILTLSLRSEGNGSSTGINHMQAVSSHEPKIQNIALSGRHRA